MTPKNCPQINWKRKTCSVRKYCWICYALGQFIIWYTIIHYYRRWLKNCCGKFFSHPYLISLFKRCLFRKKRNVLMIYRIIDKRIFTTVLWRKVITVTSTKTSKCSLSSFIQECLNEPMCKNILLSYIKL